MARRRAVQEQEKEEFLEENPQLIETTVHIEPGLYGCDDIPLPEVTEADGWSYFMEPGDFFFGPIIDGPGPYYFEEGPIIGASEDLTVAPGFFGYDLVMFGFGPYPEQQQFDQQQEGDGPGVIVAGPAFATVTPGGFGVLSFEELMELDEGPGEGQIYVSEEEMAAELLDSASISNGEHLVFGVGDDLFGPPRRLEIQEFDEGQGQQQIFAPEGRSIEFGVDVVSGSGTIVVEFLSDDGTFQTEVFAPSSGGARLRGPAGESQFSARPDEGFEAFAITTTGDLEIFVTDIDLTTGMSDRPIDWWVDVA